MPLSEVSINVPRPMSKAQYALNNVARSASSASLQSSAIQGMLRNTTELGDIGPFAVRPSRLPRSTSRIPSTNLRSGSINNLVVSTNRHNRSLNPARYGPYHGPRPAPSLPNLSRQTTTRSNLSSLLDAHSLGRRTPRLQSYGPNGPVRPHHRSQNLLANRSMTTLRSYQPPRSTYSRSPSIYNAPSRNRRYRAPSPGLDGLYDGRQSRGPYMHRVPSGFTIASSSGSMLPYRQRTPGYRYEINNSHPSFTRFSSPAVSIRHQYQRRGYGTSRTMTPMSFSAYNIRNPSRGSAVSSVGVPKSPTGSTVPAYYDYSESFLEEDCFSSDVTENISAPPLNMDQTIFENFVVGTERTAQTPFGFREGSVFRPAELPTHHNRRPSDQSRYSYRGIIPKRVSSIGAPERMMEIVSKSETGSIISRDDVLGLRRRSSQRTRRRASTISHQLSPSPSIFFPKTNRSPRNLITLVARVHSQAHTRDDAVKDKLQLEDGSSTTDPSAVTSMTPEDVKPSQQHVPLSNFRPISFASQSSIPSTRPKTCEGRTSGSKFEIYSPMPERPMSSQSRKRFSKILGIDDNFAFRGATLDKKPFFSAREKPIRTLASIIESSRLQPVDSTQETSKWETTTASTQDSSERDQRSEFFASEHKRRSQVASPDKSTIESLLDRHIESLGLHPDLSSLDDSEPSIAETDHLDDCMLESTIKLTKLLDSVPTSNSVRQITTNSCRNSSLVTSERNRLRPRRLFASMDAKIPTVLMEKQTEQALISSDLDVFGKHMSYGWQTLPSSSQLHFTASTSQPSLLSGELADIDTSTQTTRLKLRSRSEIKLDSPSAADVLSTKPELPGTRVVSHRKSKSDIVARQISHRRRRLRIMFRMRTKSSTLADLTRIVDISGETAMVEKQTTTHELEKWRKKLDSPVRGYAELSGDSILPEPPSSLACQLSPSPPIRTHWSSIVAAMPEPGKQLVKPTRKASVRTQQSQRSNTSLAEPLNSTRLKTHLPKLGSIPRLAPPELGAPLTISELNLSIPYAEAPSTIRPTVRETKSFFSDDSSAQQRRTSIRKKFHLHSLRTALPATAADRSKQTQNGPTQAILSHSCRMKGRQSYDDEHMVLNETVAMSDFAYRKLRVVEKVKGWWKRQCMQKLLSAKKRKGEKFVVGGSTIL